MILFERNNQITQRQEEPNLLLVARNSTIDHAIYKVAEATYDFLQNDGSAKIVHTLNLLLSSYLSQEDTDRESATDVVFTIGQISLLVAKVSDHYQLLLNELKEKQPSAVL